MPVEPQGFAAPIELTDEDRPRHRLFLRAPQPMIQLGEQVSRRKPCEVGESRHA
jgi:hypothetical protein